MDLFCWINSVADGNNRGAETALLPSAHRNTVGVSKPNRSRASILRKCLLRATMERIEKNRIKPRRF